MLRSTPAALRVDAFPTPMGLPRLSVSRVEALGMELFLPNGITRAGWLTVPGPTLDPVATAAPERLSWSWELWPWPRAFVARLACVWERRAWRDAHGVELDWCLHPPAAPGTPIPAGGPAAPARSFHVERHEGASIQLAAELHPTTLTHARWDWRIAEPTERPPWRVIWAFRGIEG